jgi:hypothetical protein
MSLAGPLNEDSQAMKVYDFGRNVLGVAISNAAAYQGVRGLYQFRYALICKNPILDINRGWYGAQYRTNNALGRVMHRTMMPSWAKRGTSLRFPEIDRLGSTGLKNQSMAQGFLAFSYGARFLTDWVALRESFMGAENDPVAQGIILTDAFSMLGFGASSLVNSIGNWSNLNRRPNEARQYYGGNHLLGILSSLAGMTSGALRVYRECTNEGEANNLNLFYGFLDFFNGGLFSGTSLWYLIQANGKHTDDALLPLMENVVKPKFLTGCLKASGVAALALMIYSVTQNKESSATSSTLSIAGSGIFAAGTWIAASGGGTPLGSIISIAGGFSLLGHRPKSAGHFLVIKKPEDLFTDLPAY